MNPKLPQYYGVISLFAQFLPYLASIACLIAWLITWRFKWLKWSLAALLFLVAGTLALQRLQAYLPPGPLRDGM
ncbi:hypothetical protein [Chromobacterium sp. IIBBL 290-4]|uniref:hypothetical protein n=1 Tax=Chromobacterium sp. IIBBL 290-4 TaxID=2953890 RepID=UPI0020B67AF9|nr:hypothetical protein [Chromobacterium sp. IIBBL 290-4]UTH74625.1 hypothetical protein NKT35_00465 [Chromobacterium sp. IIBBL 290-4]